MRAAAGEIVAAQLAQVGIRVSIENLEWAQWLDQVFTRHDFDMSIVAHAEPMDYDIYARDDYYFGYSSAEFKALIAALDDTIEPSTRTSCLQRFSASSPRTPSTDSCSNIRRLAVWNAHLHGVGFETVLGVVDLARAYFDRSASSGARAAMGTAARRPLRVAGPVLSAAALLLCLSAARRFGAPALRERLAVLLRHCSSPAASCSSSSRWCPAIRCAT